MRLSSLRTVSIPPLNVLTRDLSLSTTVALYAVRNVESMEMETAEGKRSAPGTQGGRQRVLNTAWSRAVGM